MALNFMDLVGSMVQGTMNSTTSSRMSSAGSGIQDILSSLMGAGQSMTQKVGGDNLAATGMGALLGALMGNSRSTTANTLGGGMMGLLGMMAYKALKNSMGANSSSNISVPQNYTQPSIQQQESDAEIILTAMIDAAKADGQIDSQELNKITASIQSSGAGQEGMNYVIKKLQGPMETAKIIAAVKNRPDLAAQVYSASLMTIEVDTEAERRYLNTLAKGIGLSDDVVRSIEQMTNSAGKTYQC